MNDVQESLIIESLVVGPFQTNVYVIGCVGTNQGAIIDAGGDARGLLFFAKSHDLTVSKILQTHAHIDHVGALTEIKQATNAPIYLHRKETPLYEGAPQQGMMFGMPIEALPPVDHWLAEGDRVQVGELEARVLHLPGHSPGSIAFYFEKQKVLFSGDVLFANSIGRTDLPGGDVPAIKKSLERLKKLPDDVVVLSGHGPETTIGREKRHNPFLTQSW